MAGRPPKQQKSQAEMFATAHLHCYSEALGTEVHNHLLQGPIRLYEYELDELREVLLQAGLWQGVQAVAQVILYSWRVALV